MQFCVANPEHVAFQNGEFNVITIRSILVVHTQYTYTVYTVYSFHWPVDSRCTVVDMELLISAVRLQRPSASEERKSYFFCMLTAVRFFSPFSFLLLLFFLMLCCALNVGFRCTLSSHGLLPEPLQFYQCVRVSVASIHLCTGCSRQTSQATWSCLLNANHNIKRNVRNGVHLSQHIAYEIPMETGAFTCMSPE